MPKSKKPKLKQALASFHKQQVKAKKSRATTAWQEEKAKSLKSTDAQGRKQSGKSVAAAQLRAQERQEAALYTDNDKILLIGEGNFSFARALSEHTLCGVGNGVIATAYDDQEVAQKKYADEVAEHTAALEAAGAMVMYSVDATDLSKSKALRGRRFTRIVFNFPHAGAGIKDQDRNIRVNQDLLLAFFSSAAEYLTAKSDGDTATDGEIHITIKSGEPYDSWQIRRLAKSRGFRNVRSLTFRPERYPGYVHRRTLGFKDGVSATGNEEISEKRPRTYIFVRAPPKDETADKSAKKESAASTRATKRSSRDSDSEEDDS